MAEFLNIEEKWVLRKIFDRGRVGGEVDMKWGEGIGEEEGRETVVTM